LFPQMVFPYGWPYVFLLTVQASLIGLPSHGLPEFALPCVGRAWGLVLPISIGGVIGILIFFPGLAQVLTWLSLIAFPILFAAAVGWAMHGARPWLAVVALPLLLLAMFCTSKRAVDLASLSLTALSVVTLGRLLVGVMVGKSGSQQERRYSLLLIRVALVVTATIDAILVFWNILQKPDGHINHAKPGIPGRNGTTFFLPKLQYLTFDGWLIGYEDVFVAAVFGALLAEEGVSLQKQWLAAVVTLALSLLFSLLFWVVNTVPDTVPIAVACLLFWNRSAWVEAAHDVALDEPMCLEES